VVLRCSLAFVWLWTGVVCIRVPADGLELIGRVGMHGSAAATVIRLVSVFEIGLGILLLAGAWPRSLAAIQIVLIAGFTAIVTVFLPEFWLHPFGAISKNVVLMGAALVSGWSYPARETG
jgi:uncharacterized membrane protein YphA (DoxX/SURF4 family)